MKLKYMLPLLWLCNFNASAQLSVTPGGQFSVLSDTRLALKNIDLINNGNLLLATTSPVSFTGDVSSSIEGDQPVRFFKLEINKSANQSVVLHKPITVASEVSFTSGFLDLNGFNVDLETTGTVIGENNNRRFIGTNGGQIILSATLNAPANANPGNLGMVITSNQDLGQVIIKRGHQSQNGAGLISSILRYYEISPVNNNAVNATLRFNYFDEELNGIDENALSFFKSSNATNWLDIGSSSKDKTANFAELTGTDPFSRFTLSAISSPLPIRFISFNINCDENRVYIKWKTAQEQNSDHFDVEKSTDGSNWTVAGRVSAAGNSSIETNYQFIDTYPSTNMYYRIAEHDVDGKVQYTNTLRSSCGAAEVLRVWPNPVHEKVNLNIVAASQSEAIVKLFDDKGTLLKTKKANLLKGSNQLTMDFTSLANGIYYLFVEWNNGQTSKTVQVVKR